MATPRSTPDASPGAAPERGPAQQQPGETNPAFEAFRRYLELGSSRSTARVARELGKSKTLMDRWSTRHRWVARVQEFTAEATRQVDAEHMDVLAKRARRQAEIAQMHGEASIIVAREILRRFGDPANAERELAKMDPQALLQLEGTLARAHNRAVITERLALGMTTDQGGEELPRSHAEELARRMSDDELDARLTGVDELAAAREAKRARKEARGG